MGGLCTTGVQTLPDPKLVITGTEIPEWVSAGGQKLFQQAASLAESPYPAYTGPRVASYDGSKLTAEERQAAQMLTEGAISYQPYIDESYARSMQLGQGYNPMTAEQLMGQQFSIEEAQPYIDMYQRAMDPAVEEIQRQLDRKLIADRAKAVGSGAFGGSRAYIGEIESAGEAARSAAALRKQAGVEGLGFAAQQREQDRAARFGTEQARRGAYETEEASRISAAQQIGQFAPVLQGLQQQAASGLLSAGEAKRTLDQMALDLAYADYVEQREYPFQMVNYALGALKGVPYETTQTSLQQGQQYIQTPSIYGQTIGGLGSLASAYFLANKSDKRLKKEIKLAYVADNGIKVYDWEWNDIAVSLNVHHSPTHGVMAQEIKEIFPEAVVLDSDGFYSVNYNHPEIARAI